MKYLKLTLSIALTGFIHLNLNAQQMSSPNHGQLVFEKLIYHSGHCNGACPQIDLEIDSNNNVLLKREFWKGKGVIDNHRSGNFKGKIEPKTYFSLITTLIASNYIDMKFPPVFCCDAPITTIIIYANGKRTYLSSMTPPENAHRLIASLYDLATKLEIPSTSEEIKLEN